MSVSTFRFLRITVATLAALVVLVVTARLAVGLATTETRGTVPLERLARTGSALERVVAQAVADSLAAKPYLPPDWTWYARRERSADGDTILFRIYRAKDANLLGRMLRPDPDIAGGAIYVISTGELSGPGIGVR
ncbi:MAG TPA: hypothetical protein VM759_05515 [Longimicrobium sp.]|nr:hypothetical protein [Longimicrobium sp.]